MSITIPRQTLAVRGSENIVFNSPRITPTRTNSKIAFITETQYHQDSAGNPMKVGLEYKINGSGIYELFVFRSGGALIETILISGTGYIHIPVDIVPNRRPISYRFVLTPEYPIYPKDSGIIISEMTICEL